MQVDQWPDVELIAIGAAAQNLGTQANPRQAAAQHVVRRDTGVGDVGVDRERKIDDPAPLRPVSLVVDVPLRIEGAAHADGPAGLPVVGEMDPGGHRPGVRPDLLDPPDRPSLHLRAGCAVPGGP